MNNKQADTENRPASLEGAPGNLRYVPGEHMKNALGVAALLHVVTEMLGAVVQDPCRITKEDFEEFRETINFVKRDIPRYVESFQIAVGDSLPSRFAVFSQGFGLVSRDFDRVSQDSVTPFCQLARITALLDLPQKRNPFTKELQETEEERTQIRRHIREKLIAISQL
ncbi:hypothetical protein HDV63DRAFT_400578 [Trichoderma sp. SZMC 28014]